METYIFFGLALLGIGWLWGNFVREKEKANYTTFIIDSLVANRFLRTHRVEIMPKVFVTHIIRWDTPEKSLKNMQALDAFHLHLSNDFDRSNDFTTKEK